MTYMFPIVGELLCIIGEEFVGFMRMFKGSAGALVAQSTSFDQTPDQKAPHSPTKIPLVAGSLLETFQYLPQRCYGRSQISFRRA